jgi:membrane-bound ClpP family serine protease
MDLSTWAFIFFAIALVFYVAEVFLPSHGMLGILGTLAMVGCIVVCFRINQYLGLGVMLASLIAAPFATLAAIKVWPKTPVGRRMVLQPFESHVAGPSVKIGDIGVAMSELRPMGTCEFAGERFEVRSQLGMIAAGTKVKVIGIDAGRLVVRADA